VHQLQDYLKAAVNASQRRLCLFIDGLDEILPESDHGEVVGYLKQLATCDHVNIIISSRPWSVFRGHCIGSRTLHMQSINTKATVRYLENIFGSLPEFNGVSWRCQQHGGALWCEHSTVGRFGGYAAHVQGDAHVFVHELVQKSRGNFLWLSLVTNTILRLSKTGVGLTKIREEIEDLPCGLDTYFRRMIFERGDKQTRRITAMALSIALLPETTDSWIPYWLLINYINGGAPSLEQRDFALVAPYRVCDYERAEEMMQQTGNFVGECCRDILDTSGLQGMMENMERITCPYIRTNEGISFVHRTIYDFLQTQGIQELLNNHKPQSFQSKYFRVELEIAGAKVLLRNRSTAMEGSTASSMNYKNGITPPEYLGKLFSSTEVQIAIKYFLEFGAELVLTPIDHDAARPDGGVDPLATLRKYLPMDADSEWPALLESYLQPKKREEL
jgi:hypothetical protein